VTNVTEWTKYKDFFELLSDLVKIFAMRSISAATLRKAELFAELDDIVLSSVAGHAVRRELVRDEILFIAGEPAQGLYVLTEGSVRAFRAAPDGREQVIHVETAVTTFAEVPVFDDGTYPSTVAANETSIVYFIDRDRIRSECIKHPELALAAARLLARRLRKCAELVESLSLREVGQRLAEVFLHEAEAVGQKSPKGVVFDLRMTHSQLAARIGTVREVVTRSMMRLQASGLLEIDGKRVTIPDLDDLRDFAQLG
jgi:CRP/FNR family transcriptional regulator